MFYACIVLAFLFMIDGEAAIRYSITRNSDSKLLAQPEFIDEASASSFMAKHIFIETWGKPSEYTISSPADITQELIDKQNKKDSKKALREKLKTKDLTLKELNELVR